MSQGEIGLGIIGAGGFGLYALQHFAQIPGIRLVAMAGTSQDIQKDPAIRRSYLGY